MYHLIIKTKQLFGGNCIENCANNHTEQYLQLPKETFKINQLMCEERWNRTGRLCGKCLPEHSPLAYSYDMRCVKCPEGNKKCLEVHSIAAFGPLDNLLLPTFVSQDQCYLLTSPWIPIILSQTLFAPEYLLEVLLDRMRSHPRKQSPICTNIWYIGTAVFSVWNLDYL